MRNPLSAILQSADEISDYLAQKQLVPHSDVHSLRGTIEAVETIMLCCQHQRRVIDDVLTLSKMNADMLTITAVESNPIEVVNSVIKMFSGDARKQDIILHTEVESSLHEMSAEHLLFDPSRVSQVLVNLLGNAIKFTRDCPVRQIKVSIGAFASRPSNGDHGVEYVETHSKTDSNTSVDHTVDARPVYLRIVVQDTGVGMVDSERRKLFHRFTQGKCFQALLFDAKCI